MTRVQIHQFKKRKYVLSSAVYLIKYLRCFMVPRVSPTPTGNQSKPFSRRVREGRFVYNLIPAYWEPLRAAVPPPSMFLWKILRAWDVLAWRPPPSPLPRVEQGGVLPRLSFPSLSSSETFKGRDLLFFFAALSFIANPVPFSTRRS